MADKNKFGGYAVIELEAGRGPFELRHRQLCLWRSQALGALRLHVKGEY